MQIFYLKRSIICLIALAAFSLYGCGGSSSSSRMPEIPVTEGPTPEEQAEADRLAEEERLAAEQAEADRLAEEERLAAIKQAKVMGLTMAIADPDGDGKFPEDNELTHRRPGEDVTFANGGQTTVGTDELDKNDPSIKNANEFQTKSSSSSIDLMGYEANMYERRTTKGATDTLTVYTDVEEPGDEAYNMYFASTTADDLNGIESVVDEDNTDSDAVKTTYNTVTFTQTEIASVVKQMKGSKVPTGPNQSYDIETGDSNAFNGTFYGIPGKYTCTSTCEFDSDKDGAITLTGTLTFQPNATNNDTQDAHVVADVHPDEDYLSFGYWVQSMPMGSGTKYGVSVFSGGSMPYGGENADTQIKELHGKATYDGSATGLYARKELTVEDGRAVVGTSVAAGQFSADVSLTAYFGNEIANVEDAADVAASQTYSINGTVDNFQDMNRDMVDSSWAVSLNKAEFEAGGTATNTFDGTTGGGVETQGMWTGGFFGDSTNVTGAPDGDLRTPGTINATQYPSGVAGEFTGHFNNGHVIGAFGASR